MKSANFQVAGTFPVSTTGNIDDLDFAKCGVIVMTNATLATIRGLKAGFPGQRVTLLSTGAGQVDLAHQNAGSVAGNRLVNLATSAPTSLFPGAGSATYIYDEVTARWRLLQHEQGGWIQVPYNAGDFTTPTGAWTVDSGDVGTFAYLLIGKALSVDFFLSATSVSLATASLKIKIPGGFTANKAKRQIESMIDAGTGVVGFAQVGAAGTTIDCFKDITAANWSIATNATYILGGITFEPQ